MRLIRSTKLFFILCGNVIVHKIVKEFKPDIIHIQGAGTSLLLTLFLNRRNVVITQHGILSEELKYKNKLFQKLNHFFTLGIEKLLISRICNFIFISRYSKEVIVSYHRLNCRNLNSAVIPNALDDDFLSESKGSEGMNRILYVGTIRRLKGLLLLIEALHSLHLQGVEIYLDIAGDFEEEDYKAEIQQFIQTNSVSELLHFHGWMDQHRVKELMLGDRIFVLPSSQENLPMSVIEAMTSGMIVIASDVGAMKEMLTDGVTGFLFEAGNKEQLSSLLNNIVNNKVNLEQLGANARKQALQKYNPDTIAQATFSFYRKINGNPGKINRN